MWLWSGAGVEVERPEPRARTYDIALDADTVAVLKRHRVQHMQERLLAGPAWTDSGLVFTRPDGRALVPDLLTCRLHELARAAGLPPIRGIHGLRHAYASSALSAGAR